MSKLFTKATPKKQLLDYIDSLEQRIVILTGEEIPDVPCVDISLTMQENKLLFLFALQTTVTSKEMITALYPDAKTRTGKEKNTCSIFIVRLRKKLEDFNIIIENIRGSHWYVSPGHNKILRGWYGG